MKKILISIIVFQYIFSIPSIIHGQSSPTVISETAIMMDAKSGTVLYEKNANTPMYPGLTKIATAIYAIEHGNLDDIVTISENAVNVEGTTVFLEEGEEVPLKKLIQGLLINSGNDAGIAIAEHLSGSVEQFATDINQYLKDTIGVKNTHFENPHGLFDDQHVTTANDLAVITKYALQNDLFKEIFGTVTLDWNGKSWDTQLISHHKMLKGEIPYEEVTGGKTGFVSESGHTLATSATGENISLIVITMMGYSNTDAYNDTTKLLDYGFEHFESDRFNGGSIVQIANQGFRIPNEVYFTKPLNTVVHKQLNKNGYLEITDQEGDILDRVELEKLDVNEQIHESSKEIIGKSHTSDKMNILFYGFMTSLILVFALFIVRFIRKRRRSQRSFYREYY